MEMDSNNGYKVLTGSSEKDKELMEKVIDFGKYFEDMTFKDKAITDKFNVVFIDDSITEESLALPHELEYFSYNYFTYAVVPSLGKYSDGEPWARFNRQDQILSICEKYLDCGHVILHEMIHLHEYVLCDKNVPLIYHDVLYWYLYQKLKETIKNLDEVINSYVPFVQFNHSRGGNHDILFFLKGLDLDLRLGYAPGTVCGYETAGFDYQLIQINT